MASPLRTVALPVGAGILHSGQSVFYADGVAEPPDGRVAVPEVTGLPAAVQVYSALNAMVE